MHSSSDQNVSDFSPTKHVQPPKNPWVTGGDLRSKDAVLIFRISALTDHFQNRENDEDETDDTEDDDGISLVSDNVVNKRKFDRSYFITNRNVKLNSGKQSVKLSSGHVKKSCPTKSTPLSSSKRYDVQNIKKRSHESLSSSDNSISSACDDPADIEADIISASEQQATNSHDSSPQDIPEECESTVRFKQPSKSNTLKDYIRSSSCNRSSIREDDEHNIDKENIDTSKEGTSVQCSKWDMPAKKLHITYKFQNAETKLLRKIFQSHGLIEVDGNQNFNILWTGAHLKPDVLRNLTSYQRVNHFPRSYELTRKDRLYKNIVKMQHLRGFKHFDIVPLSFMLPIEYRELLTAHRSIQRGPWIVKPAASSRGRGIFIVNSPEQISMDEQVIVSKYIADPLCIDGHKCDVRLYVAVTSFDPLVIYMYEEGLVRLATVKYERNAENLWNSCMHLCNYSINKYHSDYIKATDSCEDVGHKWTFSALLRHLKNQGCDTKELMLNIEDIIIKSILSCTQSIVSACRMFVPNHNNCFELYGFDILIDDTLKPWLLETNLSPSLCVDTPLDAKVKATMVADLLTLVGLPAMGPIGPSDIDSRWDRLRRSKALRRMEPGKKASQTNSVLAGLTSEEVRIVRHISSQYNRRGGFARIFPTSDSMQKYGQFLDNLTGIPLSTISVQGTTVGPQLSQRNLNQTLHSQLFPNIKDEMIVTEIQNRIEQYERTLETSQPLNLFFQSRNPKCSDEAMRLRKIIRRYIENGNELSVLQSRRAFSLYLECVLRRLSQDPKPQHENLILKFILRSGTNIRTPNLMKQPYASQILGKDRSALIAKLLSDYIESYNRDTDSIIDQFDRYGRIHAKIFDEFLAQAQETDLESILSLHTNHSQHLPFLYNRCSLIGRGGVSAPPIPTGPNGFLKALPFMVGTRAGKTVEVRTKCIPGMARPVASESTMTSTRNSVPKKAVQSNSKNCANKSLQR